MGQPTNFIDEIQRHTGESDWLAAERIATHVLHALRPMLRSDERKVLASHLPPSLGAALAGQTVEVDDSVDHFDHRIAEESEVPLPRAIEQGRIVCALLAQRLSPAEHARLVRDQPMPIAMLFDTLPGGAIEPEDVDEDDASWPHDRDVGNTLATGRPGSRHPVSESRIDRTQSHSVARESNPHGDSKLSSAEGLTQEQVRESLGTGATRLR